MNIINNADEPIELPTTPRRVTQRRAPQNYVRKLVFSYFVLAFAVLVYAQSFNADTYLQQGLRFESGGDYTSARESFNNALEIRPNFFEAAFGKARVTAAAGEPQQAKNDLNTLIRDYTIVTAEPYILLARLHMADNEYSAARFNLTRAQGVPQNNNQLDAERNFLEGRLAQFDGEFTRALQSYSSAIRLDPRVADYHLASADIRFALGAPEATRATLENYVTVSGNQGNAEVFSLLGRSAWATSDFDAARIYFERAVNNRSLRDREGLGQDYRRLALVYFTTGNFAAGQDALQRAVRRGDLLSYLISQTLPWIALALALLAFHLVGESRVNASSSLEIIEGPQPWTISQVYSTLFTAVPIAFIVMLVYSYLAHGNPLAVITPLQAADTKAVFLITAFVLLTLLSMRKVRAKGWRRPLHELLGDKAQASLGVAVGLGLLAAILGYRFWVSRNYPDVVWLQGFYLDFSQLTPFVIVAALLVPVAEVYFRAFATTPLSQRYGDTIGLLIATSIFALVLATPAPLLVVIGVALGGIFMRNRDGRTPIIAQATLHVGLILALGFSTFVRSLMINVPF
ncbi:MAG: tetratricopeptide repeat protein [Deinococcota bacterium]